MEMEELEACVVAGHREVARSYQPDNLEKWWPPLGINGQSAAATWGWGLVLHAAQDRFSGQALTLNAPFLGRKHRVLRQELVNRLCLDEAQHQHVELEVVVDLSIHGSGYHACGPLLTAECEVHAQHGTGRNMLGDDGYAWDFYKLLQVASPLRLFLARVGACEGIPGQQRRDELVETLQGLVRACRGNLLRPGDELGVVILPEQGKGEEWRDARLLVLKQGELVQARPWADPRREGLEAGPREGPTAAVSLEELTA
jgi:hypothetical protein